MYILGISRGDHPFQSKSNILNCQKETAVCAFARTKQCRWYATDMLVTYWLKAHHVLSRCPTLALQSRSVALSINIHRSVLNITPHIYIIYTRTMYKYFPHTYMFISYISCHMTYFVYKICCMHLTHTHTYLYIYIHILYDKCILV